MQKYVFIRLFFLWLIVRYSKLQDWDDEDGFGPSRDPADDANAINKNSRVVVLKRMFTLAELDEDASLLLDLKEDVRDECSSLGEVTNVVLYDVRTQFWAHLRQLTSFTERARGRNDRQIPRSSKRTSMRPRKLYSLTLLALYLTHIHRK